MSADPHHGSPFIQHHYDDAKHQFDSGKTGIWFFLVQEILFFSALFVAYILYRSHHPEIFAYASHYLDVKMGAINTAVLIVSSLTAAWAVRCAQLEQKKGLVACLGVTIVCAFGFLGIKYMEYSHKFHEGILFGSHFDPCVASGGPALLNKKNHCPGTKSSIVWNAAEKKASAGCLAGPLDQDLSKPGLQASCEVLEVQVSRVKESGTIRKVEGGKRPISACEGEAVEHAGEGLHSAGSTEPCYTLERNPYICPETADKPSYGAIVHYGDHVVRGEGVEIQATCTPAPAPAVAATDPYSEGAATPAALGQGDVVPYKPVDKHAQRKAFANGPPPPNTNMFFSIYFAMTGLHGIHVLVGIFIFIWLFVRAAKGHFTAAYFGPIDYAALYWHLVDLIWIFLFPLLYLIH